MTSTCPTAFDQALLSGALDHELTQRDAQRVRLHLEDCAACRAVFAEMQQLREVTMTTRVDEPRDIQWDESPRTTVSAVSRRLGWLIALIWLAGTTGFALWQLAISPEDLAPKLIVFGGLFGGALLFASVLLDRLRDARTDRYRGVDR